MNATLALIGDYGSGDINEASVAQLVQDEHPAWLGTLGDNVYSDEGYENLVGKFYGNFRSNHRMLPVAGNHDYLIGIENFDRYFNLTKATRTYSIRVSDHLVVFVVDSTPLLSDPAAAIQQRDWLASEAAKFPADDFKIVLMHHPPYNSGTSHGDTPVMKWDFSGLGISAVFSGHEHIYEHLNVNGADYFTAGTGGKTLYHCGALSKFSIKCIDQSFGAMFIYDLGDALEITFKDTSGYDLDVIKLTK